MSSIALIPVVLGVVGLLAAFIVYRSVLSGVVYCPYLDVCYFAAEGQGAWRQKGAGTPEEMSVTAYDPKLSIYEERMQIGMAEDIVVLEAQQIGVSSQFAQQGRFCPELEPSVHAFQKWYAKRMSAVS